MESYPLLNHAAIVHISLFHHLNNAIALKSRLVAASLLSIEDGGQIERENLNFAFIDAGMVRRRLDPLEGNDSGGTDGRTRSDYIEIAFIDGHQPSAHSEYRQ